VTESTFTSASASALFNNRIYTYLFKHPKLDTRQILSSSGCSGGSAECLATGFCDQAGSSEYENDVHRRLVRGQQRGYIPLLLLVPMRVRVLVLLVNAPARVGCWPQSWCQCSHRYKTSGSTEVFGHFTLNFNFERRVSTIVMSANEDRLMYTLYFWTPCDQNMNVTSTCLTTLHRSVNIGDFSTHISYLIL